MCSVSLATRRGNMWSLDPLRKQGLTPLCFCHDYYLKGASLVAQMVKRLPAVQETLVWSLGRKDPLEKEMATHSSILAWKIPWMEEPGRLQSMGLQRVRHDWATSLSLFLSMSSESMISPNQLIHCCPLLILLSVFSNIRVFSNESAFHIRWLKYCSFSFSISSSNEYLGLIFFWID